MDESDGVGGEGVAVLEGPAPESSPQPDRAKAAAKVSNPYSAPFKVGEVNMQAPE